MCRHGRPERERHLPGRQSPSRPTSGSSEARGSSGRATGPYLEAPEVKVMTLHAAKGLEFPIVAVLGLREGTISCLSPNLSAEEVEEETQASPGSAGSGRIRCPLPGAGR